MFKRLFSIIGIIILALGILYISLLSVAKGSRPSLAVAGKGSLTTIVATPTSTAKVQYYLVYPGMLPDHPFYKLKMMRDKIWDFLTTNSLKKANLLLLFADKRVGAGQVLIEGNKIPLGLSTLIKGEKYLERAVEQTIIAKEKGGNISELAGRIRLAILKHQEILSGIREKLNDEGRTSIDNVLKLLQTLKEQTQGL
jgi:hypothetical protein